MTGDEDGAAKTSTRSDGGRWWFGGNDSVGGCGVPTGMAVWPGALGSFELGWAGPVKGRGPVLHHGPYCTSGPA
jgi:hypothetical protein